MPHSAVQMISIQKGTQGLISPWDSLMFGRVLDTRPNMSESHSETSTRVPFCIAAQISRFRRPTRIHRRPTRGRHAARHHAARCSRGSFGCVLLCRASACRLPRAACTGTAVDLTRKLKFVYRMLDEDGKELGWHHRERKVVGGAGPRAFAHAIW